jgi:hypothetical protein
MTSQLNASTANLADFSITPLTDWALVSVQGPDSTTYLQGQLTLDLAQLADNDHSLAAHCDAKGKMWSDLRIFHYAEGYNYLLRRNVREQQIAELKKYAIFSKITITADDSRNILGVLGDQATEHLQKKFSQLPTATQPVVIDGPTVLLLLPTPSDRYLIIAEQSVTDVLLESYADSIADQSLWLAADIAAGIPVIDAVNSEQFIPQATNLQALDAISFKKGCYSGQEMVARAKYRGANKRALYWLSAQSGQAVAAGESLELQMGDKWRKTGTVLCSARLENGELWVQAVLNNDLTFEDRLRPVGDDAVVLIPQPLPYSLQEA